SRIYLGTRICFGCATTATRPTRILCSPEHLQTSPSFYRANRSHSEQASRRQCIRLRLDNTLLKRMNLSPPFQSPDRNNDSHPTQSGGTVRFTAPTPALAIGATAVRALEVLHHRRAPMLCHIVPAPQTGTDGRRAHSALAPRSDCCLCSAG